VRPLACVTLIALLALSCAARVPLDVVRDPRFNYPPAEATAVRVYRVLPSAEYEVIGEVRGRIAAGVTMEQIERSLREEAARIGATGVVLVVQERLTERKVQRPAVGSRQPVGTSGARGGGVAAVPPQTGAMEEVIIRVHEKEIAGVVIRFKK